MHKPFDMNQMLATDNDMVVCEVSAYMALQLAVNMLRTSHNNKTSNAYSNIALEYIEAVLKAVDASANAGAKS